MGPRRWVVICLAMAAACLLAPAAADASLQWRAPQTMSLGGQNATLPVVGADSQGNAIAAWREFDGTHWRVKVAFAPAGGYFDAANAKYVSDASFDAGGPVLDVAPDGKALVAYSQLISASQWQPFVAYRAPGGAFGTPERREIDSQSTFVRAVKWGPSGQAILAMQRGDQNAANTNAALVEQDRNAATGQWGGDHFLYFDGTGGYIGPTRIAFNEAGDATIAWGGLTAGTPGDFPQEIRAVRRPVGQSFENAGSDDIPSGVNGTFQMILDDVFMRGDKTILVWDRHGSAGSFGSVEYSTRTGAGPWAAQKIAAGSTTTRYPSADSTGGVLDAAGNLNLAVSVFTDANTVSAQLAQLPAGGTTFGAPAQVNPAAATNTSARGIGIDGSDNLDYFYETDDGTNSHLWGTSRTGGTFDTPHDVGTYDDDAAHAGRPVTAVAASGHAVVVWGQHDGANYRIGAVFGDPAPPPTDTGTPPPVDTTPPAPPPPPEPPVPSAIQPARPIAGGKATVLTATVSGQVDRLEWQIDGNKFNGYVVNGVLQNSIRYRLRGSATIKVTAYGPGGARTFSRTLAGAREPTDATSRKVDIPSSASRVYATGDAATLLGQKSCGQMTIYFGGNSVAGCFKPIDSIDDIAAAETGALANVAAKYKLKASDAALMERAVELSDGYIGTGNATVEGLWPVIPNGGAKIVAFPQAESLTSSNAAVRIGGYAMKNRGSGFNIDLDSSGIMDLGAIDRPGGLSSLGGFPLTGDFNVSLSGGFATITTGMQVPSWLTRGGVPIQTHLQFYARPNEISGLDGLKFGPFNAELGPLPIYNFQVSYRAATNQWVGSGTMCVFIDNTCMDAALEITNGNLTRAAVNYDYGSPGKPLGTGIFLESIGGGFGLDPTRVFGHARISVASFLKVDGKMVFAFPSASAPYVLRHDEAGDAFPPDYYKTPITRPAIAMSATVSLDLPVIGNTDLGGGYMLYEAPGFAAFGGGTSLDVLGIIRYSGSVSGQYSAAQQAYNLHGDIRACLIVVDDDLCAGSVMNTSRGPNNQGGTGACLDLGPVSAGGGILWAKPHEPMVWPVDGCKWSPFKIDIRPSKVRASQAGGPAYTVKVKDGDPSQVIKLMGNGGAPRVKVSGPTGTLQSTDAGMVYTQDGKLRIMHVTGGGVAPYTVVGLQDPKPGTYTIEALPGSPAITSVSQASDQANARVSGSVSGKGATRELTYDVLKRDAQKVTFYDAGTGDSLSPIKTITGGGKGTIKWKPAPGKAIRRVVAKFELDGLPAETKTVTRFRPPPPTLPKPGKLTVRRTKKKQLVISWAKVGDATSYEVAVTYSDGNQKFFTTKAHALVVKAVKTTVSGKVTVRAVADMREGKVAAKAFKRTSSVKSQGLGRCTVKKKKLVCTKR